MGSITHSSVYLVCSVGDDKEEQEVFSMSVSLWWSSARNSRKRSAALKLEVWFRFFRSS